MFVIVLTFFTHVSARSLARAVLKLNRHKQLPITLSSHFWYRARSLAAPPESWDPRSSTCFPCSIARDARPAQYEEGQCGCSERRRKDCKAFGLESQRWVFQVCHFIHSIWTLTGRAIGNSGGVCSGLEDTSYESLCRQGEWLGVLWTPEHPRMLISLLENDTVWRTHSYPTSHVLVDQWKVKE